MSILSLSNERLAVTHTFKTQCTNDEKTYPYPFIGIVLPKRKSQIKKYQLPLNRDSIITYESIVKLDSSYTSKLLYTAAKTWFVNNFGSAKAVIQTEDLLSGRFMGKFNIAGASGGAVGVLGERCWVYLQLDIKDGKYRYRFYGVNGYGYMFGNYYSVDVNAEYLNYLHENLRRGALTNKNNVYKKCYDAYEAFDKRINELITSLNSSMKNSKSDSF